MKCDASRARIRTFFFLSSTSELIDTYSYKRNNNETTFIFVFCSIASVSSRFLFLFFFSAYRLTSGFYIR